MDSRDRQIRDFGMSEHPKVVYFNGWLYCFHQGKSASGDMWYTTSLDAYEWTNDTKIKSWGLMSGSPGAAVWKGTMYVFHQNYGDGGDLFYLSTTDGHTWSDDKLVTNRGITDSPEVVVFRDKLFVFNQGYGADGKIWYTSASDPNTLAWSPRVQISGAEISNSPGSAEIQSRLYLFYRRKNTTELWYNSYDNNSWSGNHQVPNVSMTSSPGVVAFNNKLYVYYESSDNTGAMRVVVSADGSSWSNPELLPNVLVTSAPAPFVVGHQQLFTAHQGYRLDGKLYMYLAAFEHPFISDDQKRDTIAKHAPLIYNAIGEEYLPCGLDWAFPQMIRYANDQEGGKYCVCTIDDLSSASDDSLPFFKGDLVSAKLYSFWVKKFGGFFDICYFVFWPYNRGKNMGGTVYGNHVGDWEHITVRLNYNLVPFAVYFSWHASGDAVPWANVKVDSGSHPVAYAANASHGFHNSAGDHVYDSVSLGLFNLVTLTDYCTEGTPWYPWISRRKAWGGVFRDSIMAYEYDERKALSQDTTWPLWMNTDYYTPGSNPSDPNSGPIYRFGNNNRDSVMGYYRLESGPTGPADKSCFNFDSFQ